MTILELISFSFALLVYGAFCVVTLGVAFTPAALASESVFAYHSNRSEMLNTICAVLSIVLYIVCGAVVLQLFYHCLMRLSISDVANWIEQTLKAIF